MKWKAISAVLVVVLVLAVILFVPPMALINWIIDSDGDGRPDASDDFPNDPDETDDSDGDGTGDNSDAFPSDPTESRDTDHDDVGDNADIYDEGDGGVKIRITYFELISGGCGPGDTCDPFFRVDVDMNDPEFSDCQWDSPVYENRELLSEPTGGFVVCDIPERASSIVVEISVFDDDGVSWMSIGVGPEGSPYVVTVLRPFSESHSVEAAEWLIPRARLDWTIEVVEI